MAARVAMRACGPISFLPSRCHSAHCGPHKCAPWSTPASVRSARSSTATHLTRRAAASLRPGVSAKYCAPGFVSSNSKSNLRNRYDPGNGPSSAVAGKTEDSTLTHAGRRPALGDGLAPGVEAHGIGSVGAQIAEERALPSAEAMIGHGHGHGQRHVDADHADLDVAPKE